MIDQKQVLDAIKDLDHIDITKLKTNEDFNEQGMDSLDVIQTLFEIQDFFDIDISEEEISNKDWNSIEKIVNQLNLLKK